MKVAETIVWNRLLASVGKATEAHVGVAGGRGLRFPLWRLPITAAVENSAQLLHKCEHLVVVFLVLDLFGETLYSFVVRKVHGHVSLAGRVVGDFCARTD